MWVFGYGSLMWDGWQDTYTCTSLGNARLIGYRRTFNKASVRNWGTKSIPGPTLNIQETEGVTCPGLAFEFQDEEKISILQDLQKREGKAFPLEEHDVILEDGRTVKAFVPVYRGTNILSVDDEELAKLVCQAEGTSGKCIDYVLSIKQHLDSSGIQDAEVSKLAELVIQKSQPDQNT